MTILWIEGFDHYGTGATASGEMLDGVYAISDISGSEIGVSTIRSRTGPCSFRSVTYPSRFAGAEGSRFRRVLGGLYRKVGVGFSVFHETLPTGNSAGWVTFRTQSNNDMIAVGVISTGDISIKKKTAAAGTYTEMAVTTDAPITALANQHVEIIADADVGVEVRVNGVTRLTYLGSFRAFDDPTADKIAQVAFIGASTTNSIVENLDTYIDDLYCQATDDVVSADIDWIGDLRVKTIMPNDDTAQADWLKSSGVTGYTLIDEIPADDDTSYIYNEAFGDGGEVSEFELEDLTGAVAGVRAVQTYAKQRKTVAGTCNTQVSIVSGTSVSLGEDRPITEAYTYWMDVHELDPATGAPWTQSAINAMKLRIERTA